MDVIKDYLIFGNVDNRDYGIEIFFKDVDHIPKRVYERIEVPGRNGAVLIDEGRYEDVPVTYDCIALNDADRSEFVNALASQTGYQRMQDSFNNGEFYSAVFEGDVDPNVTSDREKSTFSIYFTRSAQRFLVSGEESIDVDSGDVITNPTLFESNPMLEVDGYGEISINGEKITVENAQFGEIKISDSATTASVLLTVDNLNAGDSITKKVNTEPYIDTIISFPSGNVNSCSATMRSAGTGGTVTVSRITTNSYRIRMTPTVAGFVNGTSATATAEALVSIQPSSTSYSMVLYVSASYDASANSITLSASFDSAWPSGFSYSFEYKHPVYYGNSSKRILPPTMYIDLDIGEAYGVVDDEALSFNNVVQMPSELPKLKIGDNEITFDNTVTDLKVVPRWWKV